MKLPVLVNIYRQKDNEIFYLLEIDPKKELLYD